MLHLKSKKLLLGICFLGLFISKSFVVATGDYRTFASGNWNSTSTWSRWNGASWINPAPSVPVAADGVITILTGHTITVTVSVTLAASSPDQFTINSGGILIVNSGITLNIANGVGTDLTVAGTVVNSGTLTPTGTISFSAGSLYQHNFTIAGTAGTIPTATWATTSTCEILACGQVASGPVGLSVVAPGFGNFSWNYTTQTTDINLNGLLTTIAGTFNMVSTGAGVNTLALRANLNFTAAVASNFSQSGGIFIIAAGTAVGTGNNSMTVGGTYTQTGGTCILSNATAPASANNGNGTITVTGATTISGGTLTLSASASTPAVAGGNGTFAANGGMTISGGTVNLSASSGDGSGGGGTLTTTTLGVSGTAVINLSTSTRTGGGGNGIITASGLMTVSVGSVINGSTLSGTGAINCGSYTMTGGTVNLTKTTLTATGTGNGTFNVTGACAISGGTFNANSSAVITGTTGAIATISTGALTISGGALVNFNSSTSTSSSILGVSTSVTVSGLMTVSGGTLNANTSNAATIGSNVDIKATAGLTVSGGTFNLCASTCTTGSSAGGGNTSLNITGATILSGTGILNIASGGVAGSGGNIATMNAGGSFTMNAGAPSLNLCSSATTGGGIAGSGTINITGNFVHTLASTTIQKTAVSNTGTININGSSAQTIQSTFGFNIGNVITFNITQSATNTTIVSPNLFLVNQGTTMNINDNTSAGTELSVLGTAQLNNSGIINVNSAMLDMGGTVMINAVAGTGGFFNLNTGATILTKHIDGITKLATGAVGCIRVTGGRYYGADASYTYYGTAAQFTGDGLPVSLTSVSTLTINNSSAVTTAGVTLSQPTTTAGTLTLTLGRFITSTNLFTIDAGGVSSSSGSLSAFVDGPIKKIGNTAFIFPTGDVYQAQLTYPAVAYTTTAKCARIEIGAPTNLTDAFTAEYHKKDDPCNTTQVVSVTNGAGINHVSYKEWWELTRTSAAAVTPTVKLYWESGSSAAAPGTGSAISSILPADLRIAECIASTWTVKNSAVAATTGTAAGPGTIVTNIATTFTTGTVMPFTFAGPTVVNPLPIELLSFSGYGVVSANQLNWTTAAETNNNYFELERSANANEFLKIATIAGAGNSTTIKEYDYRDNSPGAGINYYRLKQVDYNGDYTYSNIISIDQNTFDNSLVQVYPNPSSDVVNIVTSNNITSVTIYNMRGEIVYSNLSQQSNSIEFKPLSDGVYIVKALDTNGNISTSRFVKK